MIAVFYELSCRIAQELLRCVICGARTLAVQFGPFDEFPTLEISAFLAVVVANLNFELY